MRANTSIKLRTWRRYVLLAAVVLVPLAFFRGAADPINVPKLWVLMVSVAIAGVLFLTELVRERDLSGLQLLLLPAVVIAAPLALSWLFSEHRGWSLMGDFPRYLGFLPYLVTVLFGLLIAETFRGDAEELAWAVVLAGGLVGAYAVIQVLGLDPLTWSVETDSFVSATMGNPNFTGGLLSLCLPVAVALLLAREDRRVPLGLVTALIVGGLMAARSQAAVGAAVACVAVMAGVMVSARWSLARAAGLAIAGLVATAAISMTVVGASADTDVIPESIERRGEWWRAALSMAAESPIVGNGPGTFALEHAQHRSERDVAEAGFSVERDPHSLPMSLVAGAGLLGALGYLALVAWVLRTTWQVDAQNIVAVGFAGASIAYLVQMLVSIDVVGIRTIFWVCLGGLVASGAALPQVVTRAQGSKKKKKGSRGAKQPTAASPPDPRLGVMAVAGVGAALVLGWWATQLLTADVEVADARKAERAGDFNDARSMLTSAVQRTDQPNYRQRLGTYLSQVAVVVGTQGREEEAGPLMSAAEEAFSYTAEIPDLGGTIAQARALHRWTQVDPGRMADVMALYERAVTLDPNNYFLRLEAGEVAISLQRWPDAERFISQALEQRGDLAIHAALALAHASQGEEEEARRSLEIAREGPGEPYLQEAEEALKRLAN